MGTGLGTGAGFGGTGFGGTGLGTGLCGTGLGAGFCGTGMGFGLGGTGLGGTADTRPGSVGFFWSRFPLVSTIAVTIAIITSATLPRHSSRNFGFVPPCRGTTWGCPHAGHVSDLPAMWAGLLSCAPHRGFGHVYLGIVILLA